jgi:hypothetical protein
MLANCAILALRETVCLIYWWNFREADPPLQKFKSVLNNFGGKFNLPLDSRNIHKFVRIQATLWFYTFKYGDELKLKM